MSRLTRTAAAKLRVYGWSEASWSYWNTGQRTWNGDRCGCTDDRCINYHHDDEHDCQCLPALLERPATRRPHVGDRVEVWTEYPLTGVVDFIGETHTSVRGTGPHDGRGAVIESDRVHVIRRGFRASSS